MPDKVVTDKYKAVWVSHSSISDFLSCPRAYYLRNVYKDPLTGHKITITSPALSLGSSVHDVIESLSVMPVEERLTESLLKKFDVAWEKVTGKKGGFKDMSEELQYKERGIQMLKRVQEHPGPILNKAIKIPSEMGLPNYFLSEEDNIILCGKIDWLEWLENEDAVNIIDFKTGRNEENGDSLQLPIYLLLATNTQKRPVKKASYWYLEKNLPAGKAGDGIVEKELPDIKSSFEKVYEVARRIKLARQLNHFVCPKGGCMKCSPLERILRGDGEKVGVSDTKQDIYILS
jgi:ATP-dependent helicase/DNAse subunit B